MASTGEPFGLFWDSENGDRTYSAGSFESWLKKFFTSGVFNGDLQVRATSGMTLEIEPGYANVDGKVKFWNGAFRLTLQAANSTYPRIDTIVITRDNVNREIRCEVVTGNYSADTPQPTAPIRNAEKYQLVLAQIYVATGATGVTQSDITDTRANTELCGYITGTVSELDFSAFTTQFEAYFAEFKSEHETEWSLWEIAQKAAYASWFSLVQAQQVQDKAAWDAWYADLQSELHNLPSNTAEYLQLEIDEIKESGMSGSILHITTTETTLEGKTVTVSGNYNNEERTAVFDSNLECTIMGIKSVGDLNIQSTDGIQIARKTINTPYYGNYSAVLNFWAATINIQGDNNLKGATVTIKDSNNVTVGTVTLSATNATGVFNATKADTYTFSATYNGKVYSEELSVTQEIVYTLQISTIPEGATVTPANDIQIWLHCAGIYDKAYTTLDEVLADNTTLLALISDNNAVDYMVRSTTWATSVCANSTAMGYIGNNDYCADLLLGDSTWCNAICNSTYFESVLNVKVPTMTSNTTPSGEVIYSYSHPSYVANYYKAFDSNATDGASFTGGIGYKFTSKVAVRKINFDEYFYLANQMPSNPGTIYFEGSNDNSNWTRLTTVNVTFASQSWVRNQGASFVNDTKYQYYRIRIASAPLNESTYVQWDEVQFYGRT